MTRTTARLALIAAALTASGCATITRGSTEDVQFVSNPPGAEVKTSLGPACVTPCTLKFDRRDTFNAVFTLGEQTQTVFVDTEVAGGGVAGVAGNVLAGGVIGVGIDVATGAGLNHVPNPVIVTFPDPQPEAAPAETEAEQPETETVATDATPREPVPAEPSETRDDGFQWGS